MKKNAILEDISIATIVLTRVPLNSFFSLNQNIDVHRGQWAYPLIGALIGFFLFLIISLLELFGLPYQIAILISMTVGYFLTGALHEDGVADFFDSLGGVNNTERQKILRDSRLGTYGVLALVVCFLLKFFLLLEFELYLPLACGLIACSSLGRFTILLLVNFSDISKKAGLTKELKKVDNSKLILCGIFSIIWIVPAGFVTILCVLALGYALMYFIIKFVIPYNKGLSGDILGLSVVFAEILGLAIIAVAFS